MAVPLEIQIKEIEPHIQDDERKELVIDVTANGKNIKNADVTVTVSTGSVDPVSGKTDANGLFKTWYIPDSGAYGKFTVTFNATLAPLDPAEESTHIIVEPKPVEFFERDAELLLGVYGIRDFLLAVLKEELEKHPDFYDSTGASRPPVFLNNFNYTSKDLPQVVCTSGSLSPLRSSIGDHCIGPNQVDYKDDGSIENEFELKGGINTLVVSFTAVAEAKNIQEKLLDRVQSVLWGIRQWSLLHGGIVITAIAAGPESTEPWGAKNLYSCGINCNLWTQWMLRDKGKYRNEKINYDMTTEIGLET